jgi:hypothetical protein
MFKIGILSFCILISYIHYIFSSDLESYILQNSRDIFLEFSKIIEYNDLIQITSTKCFNHIKDKVLINYNLTLELLQNTGFEYNKLGDELECLDNNWTYLFFEFEESKQINSYGRKLAKFLGLKKSYRGICLMNDCNDLISYFTEKYILNKYFPKLTNSINIKLFGKNSLYFKDLIENYQNNLCLNISSKMTLNQILICQKYIDYNTLKIVIMFLIIYCIIRVFITFYFHSIGYIDYEKCIGSIIQFQDNDNLTDSSVKNEENGNNYLIENKDISETKYYYLYKGLAITTSIKYITSSKESKIIDQLLGFKVLILFFIIIYENSYTFFYIPNIGLSVYSFLTGYSFFVIKFISYSYDFYKIICGAIIGYVFMDYFKNHKQSNISGINIIKFYLQSLSYIISFIILHIVQSYFPMIMGLYYFPSVQYEYFINEIFKKRCYKKPLEFFNPLTFEENPDCYKAAYFCFSELYCFLLVTTFSFILIKLEKKILDLLIFFIYIIIYVLLYLYNNDKSGDYNSLSKIYGNINMIRKPHLFFLLYFLGFNFGIMYFYHNHLAYIYNNYLSKDKPVYMPFQYNYSFVKFITQKHKYYRRIFGIIISICIILFSFNYTFIRSYYSQTNDITFSIQENNFINFIYCYEGIISGILFLFLLMIILICSTSPIWKIFSNKIILSLNKISFIIFNSCSIITTISYCTGYINPYFDLKNILLTSFSNFILITIFSVIYGVLIELPLRYIINEYFLFNKKSQENK